jgi:tRNA/tmRNA/rRNA uracil-C5-methylase (TrmA/RlmC/RlmD family)
VAAKRRSVSELFERDVEVAPSQVTVYYRTRMDFAIGGGAAGLFPRGEWGRVVDVRDCRLLSTEAMSILDYVRGEVSRREISTYDRRALRGYLRFLVIREAKFTGERLAVFVTSPGESAELAGLAAEMPGRFPLRGVARLETDGVADLSRGRPAASWGASSIEEELDGTRLAMGPNSFFQPNSHQARVLYRDLSAHLPPHARLLDLYCGVGSIGLYSGAIVTGVDRDPENIELARRNALRNGSRATFVLADAGSVELGGYDALAVDPPRAGLHPKLARRIDELGPETLLYVSCNPEALKRDLARLPRYRLGELRGYDFLPHTPHVEMLAALRRR